MNELFWNVSIIEFQRFVSYLIFALSILIPILITIAVVNRGWKKRKIKEYLPAAIVKELTEARLYAERLEKDNKEAIEHSKVLETALRAILQHKEKYFKEHYKILTEGLSSMSDFNEKIHQLVPILNTGKNRDHAIDKMKAK